MKILFNYLMYYYLSDLYIVNPHSPTPREYSPVNRFLHFRVVAYFIVKKEKAVILFLLNSSNDYLLDSIKQNERKK